jgi:hypothetical protein
MRQYLAFTLSAMTALLLAACASKGEFVPGPEDKLTEAETAALTTHARNFIAGNKRLKISTEDRDFIKANTPSLLVRYTAPKEGQLSLAWQVSPAKRIIVLLDGEFLAEGRQAWELQVVKNEETLYLKPEKKSERSALPEKAD